MTRFGVLSWLCFVVFLAAAPRAAAQSDAELERARQAFGEGVEASDAGRWEEAAARFREVMEVRATAQVKYNLAVALEHTGELSDALLLLREVVDDHELDRAARREARQMIDRIEPRLGTLTVHVSGDIAGARVLMDGDELSGDRIGVAIPADPGTHVLVVERNGQEIDRQTAMVAEGGSPSVTLQARGVPTPTEVALDTELAPTPDRGDDRPTDYGVLGEWWFWTGIAVVIVGAVLIGVAVSSGGDEQPVGGNLNPGVIEVMP